MTRFLRFLRLIWGDVWPYLSGIALGSAGIVVAHVYGEDVGFLVVVTGGALLLGGWLMAFLFFPWLRARWRDSDDFRQ